MFRTQGNTTRLVVGAYIVFVAAPLLYAASQSWFWERKHDMAPVAAACLIALLVALVYRRRWAWFLLALFQVGGVMTIAFTPGTVLADAAFLAGFALIVSPPMRAYVRPTRPVPYWQTRTTFQDGSFRTK